MVLLCPRVFRSLFVVAALVDALPSRAQETVAAQSQPAPVQVTTAQRDADTFNYVATRLRMLRRGFAVEEIKSEIVNQVDFGALTPEAVELLRRTMTVCDKALANQAKISGDLAGLDQEAKAREAKDAGAALTALGTLATGATLIPLLAALPQLSSSDTTSPKRNALLAKNAAELSSEISTFEFDLAVFRSRVQSAGGLTDDAFVNPADYDQFLIVTSDAQEERRVPGADAALVRSPRLQPAALYLADRFFRSGDASRAAKYADEAIAAAPTILRRDLLRAQAYAYRAWLFLAAGDVDRAADCADRGLSDDPAKPELLRARAQVLMLRDDYASAQPILERLLVLDPTRAVDLYNLACCASRTRADFDGALAYLKSALEWGYTDVAHMKADPDLAPLRGERRDQFRELSALRVEVAMDWRPIAADGVRLTNKSAFTLVDVPVTLVFSGVNAGTPWTLNREVTIQRLAPNQSELFAELIDTTKSSLVTVGVKIDSPQGGFAAQTRVVP